MKVLLITGNELRHRYFARQLATSLELVGVVFEKKANKHQTYEYSNPDRQLIDSHFAQRSASERAYFTPKEENEDKFDSLSVETGEANDSTVLHWINDRKPDLIQLFGSSIIQNELLSAYSDRVVNIHLGLSPYYRGSGTNFWPLVHQKPECVGATIHLATSRVDAGAILHQIRPALAAADSPHDVGNKTIKEAVADLPKVLHSYYTGDLHPVKQNVQEGILCLRKDLTADSIRQLYQNFAEGMIPTYLADRLQRNANYPIVNI